MSGRVRTRGFTNRSANMRCDRGMADQGEAKAMHVGLTEGISVDNRFVCFRRA
jgi:hypothetical protein